MPFLYLFHEDLETTDTRTPDQLSRASFFRYGADKCFRVFPDKIQVPSTGNILVRERLIKLLSKSLKQFGATLLEGRSGTGKTALASTFAQRYENVAWYSVGSSDSEWSVFFRYFEACFKDSNAADSGGDTEDWPDMEPSGIAHRVESFMTRLRSSDPTAPRLIVLDNAHNVFDTLWFPDFLKSLIYSLNPEMHLLILSRCQPPTPLWRLRSKQSLGVIGEKQLAFNESEFREFCAQFGFSPMEGSRLLGKSFGRISKIREILRPISHK